MVRRGRFAALEKEASAAASRSSSSLSSSLPRRYWALSEETSLTRFRFRTRARGTGLAVVAVARGDDELRLVSEDARGYLELVEGVGELDLDVAVLELANLT